MGAFFIGAFLVVLITGVVGMNGEKEQDAAVKTLLDALALVDAGLSFRSNGAFVSSPEWAEYAAKVINHAVAFILESAKADRLQREMITVLEIMHNRLVDERNHWKANHDAQVDRARVLVERPDMPLERVQAYANYSAAVAWKVAVDDALVTCGATADSYATPRDAVSALIDWHVSVALDPAVSKDAQALIERGAKQCRCSMRTRLVGDGCEVCNPERAAELAGE